MKAIKKVFISTFIVGAGSLFLMGSFNSIVVDKATFLKNDLNIRFAKRLDDMNGKVVIGRMAASVSKFRAPKASRARKEQIRIKAEKVVDKKEVTKTAARIVPEPAITEAPGLELTGGLYDSKPLKEGKGYFGSATVIDGVIEEIDVTLPDGKKFTVHTNERMVGNVFQYEDSETREMRSGLFYEVKKGQYMITLTDDTNFSGLRLEFKSGDGEEIISNNDSSNWAMNEQNEDENFEQDQFENRNNEQENFAQNEEFEQEAEYNEEEELENENKSQEYWNETTKVDSTQDDRLKFAFNF